MLRLITEAEKIKPVVADEVDTEIAAVDDIAEPVKDIVNADIEVEGEEISTSDLNPEIVRKACQDSVNGLVQNAWDFIANINSVIATIDYDYKEANKEALIEVLNTAVNDVTVVVGMLYSGINLIDSKTSELIQDGAEKAETLVDNM